MVALLATLALLDNDDDCSNSNLRLSSGITSHLGDFFALVSLSSSSVLMAAVNSNVDNGSEVFCFPSVSGSSGLKQRQSTADAGDSNRTQRQTTVGFSFDGGGSGGRG